MRLQRFWGLSPTKLAIGITAVIVWLFVQDWEHMAFLDEQWVGFLQKQFPSVQPPHSSMLDSDHHWHTLLILLGLGGTLAGVLHYFRYVTFNVVVVGLALGISAIQMYLLFAAQIWLSLVYPVFLILSIWFVATLYLSFMTEHERRAIQQLSESVIRHTPTAIITTDDRGIIIQENRAARQLFRRLLGQASSIDVNLAHPDSLLHQSIDEADLLPNILSGEEGLRKFFGVSVPRITDDDPLILNIQIAPLRRRKRIIGVIVQCSDITEIEQARRDRELAQREAIENLRQADKLKDEFLSTTSHELRTPLNGIIGIAESLIDGVSGELNEDTKTNLLLVVASGRRLASLVDDILDAEKLQHKELEIQQRPVDMRAMTTVVLELSKSLLGGKTIVLHNRIDYDTPPVSGDENRLQQILFNLVGNAIKFTETGWVSVSALTHKDFVELTVSDTGVGIPPEQLESIFQAFHQADASTSRNYGGTGLGLSLTRKLVELHGGKIWVESELSIGSQFHFTIPRSNIPVVLGSSPFAESRIISAQPESAVPEKEEALVSNNNSRILVVDDEPLNLQVLVNHLSLHHYQIFQASNGKDALACVEEKQPDLLILDVMMPRMSGLEVCQVLRDTYSPAELPIILLTAKNQAADFTAGFASGANDYLTKPFSKYELLARVKLHLDLTGTNVALGQANSRFAQLLEGTQEIASAYDKLTPMVHATNMILRLPPLQNAQSILLSFLEILGNGSRGFSSFRFPTESTEEGVVLKVGSIRHTEHSFNYSLPFNVNETKRSENNPLCSLNNETLHIPIHLRDQLHGYIQIDGVSSEVMDTTYQGFINTLAHFLAITLENLSFISSLEQMVAVQTKELQETLKKLEIKHAELKQTQTQLVQTEKMASLGTLVAGVAHEINNPVNFTNSGAQNLESRLKQFKTFLFDLLENEADEDVKRMFEEQFDPLFRNLDAILNGTQRIQTIVRDLRTFSRLERTDVQEVRLVSGLKSTLSLVSSNYKNQVKFECDFAVDPKLRCSPAQLNQVFMNAMVNSCQAIVAQQSKTQDRNPGVLTIRTFLEDNYLGITFQDTGCGIPEELRNKIFEPFFTTKPVGEGTGLGLSIAFSIIEKHKGFVKVDSQVGKGASFTIYLPLPQPEDGLLLQSQKVDGLVS